MGGGEITQRRVIIVEIGKRRVRGNQNCQLGDREDDQYTLPHFGRV